MFVVVTVIVKRVTGSAVPTYDRAVWIELQTAALPLGFFLITLTLYTYIDTVILGIMRTDAETGWYAASYRVYEGLMYAPSAFATGPHAALLADVRRRSGRSALALPALAARLGAGRARDWRRRGLPRAADAAAVLRRRPTWRRSRRCRSWRADRSSCSAPGSCTPRRSPPTSIGGWSARPRSA